MNWIDVLKIMGPAVLAMNPRTAELAPIIVAGINVAEETRKPGADKRRIARDAVKVGADAANSIAKRTVVPPDYAVAAYDHSVDTIIAVTNIVKANTQGDGTGQP